MYACESGREFHLSILFLSHDSSRCLFNSALFTDWVLYKDKPNFHKDQTSLNWMEYTYSSMTKKNRPLECTLNPGDIIYFPNMWWHATINLDPYSAFVSTFTQEHLFTKDF